MRNAFTLLELLVAIALGSMLIATAFSGFRVAQGYISIGNTMADENRMLAAGYTLAMDEIDNWRLHEAEVGSGAHGFADHSANSNWDQVLNAVDNRPTEDFWHWHDRLPGNASLPTDGDAWHGRSWHFPGGGDPAFTAARGFYRSASFMGGQPIREALIDQVGWYGYLEYLPPHAIAAEAGNFTGRHAPGFNFYADWCAATCFYDERDAGGGWNFLSKPHDDPGGGFASAYDPSGSDTLWQPKKQLGGSHEIDTSGFHARRLRRTALSDQVRPTHWPALLVTVRRSLEIGERKNVVEISARSPRTQEVLALRFRAWGSTLRGARIADGREDYVSYVY